jgi:multiple sugar transport system ATP-binding protein
MASVRLEKLVKRYGKVDAVRGIDLDVGDGEFMAFLGPSGCGKTSTMRMIAGLEEITGGTIYFDEKSVNRVRPRDRGVAMAFESYALYPTLSVYENLAFPLRAAKWSQADVDRRVREIAGILEITDLLPRMPRELSSGQAQRTGLARALTRKPGVFLLDEPISHLDTRQRARMRAYLKRLHIELGHTMIYVTHDQEEAMAMADRIAIMDDGRLNQVGTPEAIYHQPVDLFVAGFVGEPAMNFLVCTPAQENGARFLRAGRDGAIRVPLPDAALRDGPALPAGVTLGIRPFYVDIAAAQDERHGVPATVFVVEPLGDTAVVTVNVAETRMQIVAEPEFRAQPQQPVWLELNPNHILLFDGASRRTIFNGYLNN